MSTQIPSPSPGSREQAWMNGYTVFAVAVLLVLGLWQFLAGLTAVVRDVLYVAPPGYTFAFSVAGWGWAVLLLGFSAPEPVSSFCWVAGGGIGPPSCWRASVSLSTSCSCPSTRSGLW
jgi:hypothetical protein